MTTSNAVLVTSEYGNQSWKEKQRSGKELNP
jgi:hypothetical protein